MIQILKKIKYELKFLFNHYLLFKVGLQKKHRTKQAVLQIFSSK